MDQTCAKHRPNTDQTGHFPARPDHRQAQKSTVAGKPDSQNGAPKPDQTNRFRPTRRGQLDQIHSFGQLGSALQFVDFVRQIVDRLVIVSIGKIRIAEHQAFLRQSAQLP